MNKAIENPVNILWTGGYDSTFRMVQLSKENVTIQPYYLLGNRASKQNELNAMEKILKDIEEKRDTKATVKPIIKLDIKDIKTKKDISEAYFRLKDSTGLGSQYEILPVLAQQTPGLELGLEKAVSSKAYQTILKHGDIRRASSNGIEFMEIDPEQSSNDLIKIFGDFHFPLPLFEITKLETFKKYKELGFEETVNKTWFCLRPINDEPCGLCNPCKSVIDEGMSFRLPQNAIDRYETDERLKKTTIGRLRIKVRKKLKGY